ncbi:hypothetical protein PINS_up002388 [Pythium insidiosum]|nr:hypothetical protein PINS_up002388 [Pythium insidiosum]
MELLVRTLEDTHDEIQRVRGEVIEALKSFYGSSSALSAEDALQVAARWSPPPHPHSADSDVAPSEMEQRLQRLQRVLLDLVEQLQLEPQTQPDTSTAVQQRVVQSFAQRERLKRQMEQSRRMLQLVEKVTQLDNHLFEVDSRLDKGDIVSAAAALQSAQMLLDQLRGAEPVEAATGDDIVHFLGLQLLKKKNRLLHQLKQTHANLMTVKGGTIRIKKPRLSAAASPGGAASSRAVRALWEASTTLGLQQSKLQESVKLLAQHVLRPLFASEAATLKLTQEADGVSIAVSTEVATPRQEGEVSFIEKRLADIAELVQLLYTELLGSTDALMASFGDLLWKSPGNLESHLLTLLQAKIPKDTMAVNVYRDTVASMIQDLEQKLTAIGVSSVGSSQLRHFSSQINQLYAKKRRQQILVSARETMNRDYCNAIRVTGATERCNIDASAGSGKKDGSKGKTSSVSSTNASVSGDADDVESGCFAMPDYVVSHCAHDVVELAHQTMIEACAAETTCASVLFQTSRDVLFLFRAVVPTLYSSEIGNDARTCMLFHNDCMYIAYHMLTIGHLYKSRLPVKLGAMVTMVDMVPAFREAAESALSSFARSLLDEIISGIKAFKEHGGVGSEAALAQLETALKASLYKLNHVHAAWRDALPAGVYDKVIGLVVEPFVAAFMDHMCRETRIPGSATGKLHGLASLLLECETLFASPAQAEKHVPSLAKLRRFHSFLVQPLATIQDQFHNGDLAVFSSTELAALVTSLFRDSSERKALLRSISAP